MQSDDFEVVDVLGKSYKIKAKIGVDTPWIITDRFVLAELETVNNVINDIDLNVSERDILDSPLGRSWQIFKDEWTNFYETSKAGWKSRSTYNKTKEYNDRALDWAKKLKGSGVTIETVLPPRTDVPFTVPVWGWIAVAGIGIFGLIKYVHAKTALVGATSGLVRAKSGKPKSHKKGQY